MADYVLELKNEYTYLQIYSRRIRTESMICKQVYIVESPDLSCVECHFFLLLRMITRIIIRTGMSMRPKGVPTMSWLCSIRLSYMPPEWEKV